MRVAPVGALVAAVTAVVGPGTWAGSAPDEQAASSIANSPKIAIESLRFMKIILIRIMAILSYQLSVVSCRY
jgi:hypothetical protein